MKNKFLCLLGNCKRGLENNTSEINNIKIFYEHEYTYTIWQYSQININFANL